jgi:hypothetical protein
LAKEGKVVDGEGFEPSKPVATDLQSVPFDRSGTHPKKGSIRRCTRQFVLTERFVIFSVDLSVSAELAMGIEPAAC